MGVAGIVCDAKRVFIRSIAAHARRAAQELPSAVFGAGFDGPTCLWRSARAQCPTVYSGFRRTRNLGLARPAAPPALLVDQSRRAKGSNGSESVHWRPQSADALAAVAPWRASSVSSASRIGIVAARALGALRVTSTGHCTCTAPPSPTAVREPPAHVKSRSVRLQAFAACRLLSRGRAWRSAPSRCRAAPCP
jgi:hypothetical protein